MPKVILAHISDLHFDGRILNDRFVGIPHRLGHDKVLAFGLMTALEDVLIDCQAEGQPLRLVASGDLTRQGEDSEFAVAHSLLLSQVRLQLDPTDLLGYAISADHFSSVPGNHDQYGASGPMPGHNPAVRGVHFEDTPWHRRITEGQLTLDLFGVDTNSGHLPAGWNLGAWGDISQYEFNQLEQHLNHSRASQVTEHTVRALVMDLRLSSLGGRVPTFVGALFPGCRRRIVQICAEYEISAVLTGHTHSLLSKRLTARKRDGNTHSFYELRSPRTLVAHRNASNGFLAHEITDVADNLRWRAWWYVWKSGGFDRQPQPVADFPI